MTASCYRCGIEFDKVAGAGMHSDNYGPRDYCADCWPVAKRRLAEGKTLDLPCTMCGRLIYPDDGSTRLRVGGAVWRICDWCQEDTETGPPLITQEATG